MDETTIRQRLQDFGKRATNLDLPSSDVHQMISLSRIQRSFVPGRTFCVHYFTAKKRFRAVRQIFHRWKYHVFVAMLAILIIVVSAHSIPQFLKDLPHMVCLIDGTSFIAEIMRPKMPCDLCANLTEVPVVWEMSHEEFDRHYAYTAVPVLVKGAVLDWKAIDIFSFEFFKDFYTRNLTLLRNMKGNCQFFAYNTEFSTLEEVFSTMTADRAAYKEGQEPWYFGWSNCLEELDSLKDYYDWPSFLPARAYPGAAPDWVFMGGPGYGAGIHVDDVGLPSWQAQVRGSKTWTLIPSPECQARCKTLSVRMERGDILIVDTNTWYHSTFIHPGDNSISIGSEYD